MYWYTIHIYKCDGCDEKFYYNYGDMNDMTGYDPDAIKCPHCGHIEVVSDNLLDSESIDDWADDGEPMSGLSGE